MKIVSAGIVLVHILHMVRACDLGQSACGENCCNIWEKCNEAFSNCCSTGQSFCGSGCCDIGDVCLDANSALCCPRGTVAYENAAGEMACCESESVCGNECCSDSSFCGTNGKCQARGNCLTSFQLDPIYDPARKTFGQLKCETVKEDEENDGRIAAIALCENNPSLVPVNSMARFLTASRQHSISNLTFPRKCSAKNSAGDFFTCFDHNAPGINYTEYGDPLRKALEECTKSWIGVASFSREQIVSRSNGNSLSFLHSSGPSANWYGSGAKVRFSENSTLWSKNYLDTNVGRSGGDGNDSSRAFISPAAATISMVLVLFHLNQ